jgi:alcohol dehydrogenase class IV
MGFFTAPHFTWGPGAIEQLSALGAQRAFVLGDPNLVRRARFQRILEELAKGGGAVDVASDVLIEPTLDSVEPVAEKVRRFHPDWIVAVGGGSTIDTAKGAWARYAQPDLPLDSISPLTGLQLRAKARFVAIPSTSGSGSDATWQAHFWDPRGNLIEVASRELVPDWSLLDPELPTSMPPDVAANSGADFLTHALESLISEWANPFSDGLARSALTTAIDLPKIGRSSDGPELRTRIHIAATLAGLAVSNAQTGNAHALAYALRPVVPLPHGRLVGIVLPYVAEFSFPSARDDFATMAPILGADSVQSRSGVFLRLRDLLKSLGIPGSLAGAGIPPEGVESRTEEIVARAMATSAARASPRVASAHEWRELIRVVAQGIESRPNVG